MLYEFIHLIPTSKTNLLADHTSTRR